MNLKIEGFKMDVERQKVFWDDKGKTTKRFHEVDCVLASEYDKLLSRAEFLDGCLARLSAACEEKVFGVDTVQKLLQDLNKKPEGDPTKGETK